MNVSLCSLRVGDELFGFDTCKICEVLGERVVQPVPLSPKFVAGVVPYRGNVLTVLCFRSLLGLELRSKSANVLVLQDEQKDEVFGLAVDSMGSVLHLNAEDFEANPHTLDARRKALFAGAYKLKDSLLVYLKPELLWPMRLMELFGDECKSHGE